MYVYSKVNIISIYFRKFRVFRNLELFLKIPIISNLFSLKRFFRPMQALPAAENTLSTVAVLEGVQRIFKAIFFRSNKLLIEVLFQKSKASVLRLTLVLPTIWIQLINCLSKSNNYREFVLMFDFILSP